jgi:hypothetical protein
MKNLLIYINPQKNFFNEEVNKIWKDETSTLVKVQIDNSLGLGWKKEDILLITNFDYEYQGVKSLVIGDDNYCEISPTATKIKAIITLFDMGLIKDDLYWFHDFDAFQLEEIMESELELDDSKIAITDYGRTTINTSRDLRWSTGSIFFRKGSKDVFNWIKDAVYYHKKNEEVALLALTRRNRFNINGRIKKINITYNFATRKRNIPLGYEIAAKPLKVIHFHPFDKRGVEGENDNMAVCVYGKNSMNKVLVTKRLIDIFNCHGIV